MRLLHNIDTLPTGLTVSVVDNDCKLSGTPLATQGVTTHTLTVVNATGSDTATIDITVDLEEIGLSGSISYDSSLNVIEGVEKSYAVDVSALTQGTGTLTYVQSNAVTAGISIDASSGLITVSDTVASGTYTVEVSVSSSVSGTAQTTVNIVVETLIVAPNFANLSNYTYTTNVAITSLVISNSGGAVDTCSVNPSLPTGLSVQVQGGTCVISGTPTAVTALNFYNVTGVNTSGSDSAEATIEISSVAIPALEDISSQIYTIGVPVSVDFINNGGDASGFCGISPAAPFGLSTSLVSGTCRLSGTPSSVVPSTVYTVNVSNIIGSDTATIEITINPAVPNIVDAPNQTFIHNHPVSYVFTNSGGVASSCSVSPALPSGMSITTNVGGCRIGGTPLVLSPSTLYTVTATNAGGLDTATVDIIINPENPNIQNKAGQTYRVGTSITNLVFTNTGGGSLSSCVLSSLPAGLSTSIVGDDCVLSGTPTTTQSATVHTMTATNITNSDNASVSITILPPVALPNIANKSPEIYAQNESVNLLFFNSGGGELTSCSADSLPVGLSVAISGKHCMITGTATVLQVATTHTITATNVSGSDIATVDITVLAPPALLNQSAKVFHKNSLISNVAFTNTGGDVSNCSISPSLVVGLVLSANAGTCVISGTPAQTRALTTYTVTASNGVGSDTATIDISISGEAPAIDDASAKVYFINTAISPSFTFASTGGPVSSCSVSPALPAGVSVTTAINSCSIFGTPTVVTPLATYTVTATGAGGTDTATVDITVDNTAPNISSLAIQNLSVDSAIVPIVFTNTGGNQLTSCALDVTPAGLSVSIVGNDCQITGTPTIEQSTTIYTMTATNNEGSDTAIVHITIGPSVLVPNLNNIGTKTYTVGIEITPLVFANSGGGLLTSCGLSTVPLGLSVTIVGDDCVLSGTPTSVTSLATYTMTATNTSGFDTAIVDISIEATLSVPDIVNASSQTYVVDIPIEPLVFANTGGGSVSSCALDLIPAGLSVSISGDDCLLSGIPTAVQASTTHSMTINNASGSDVATVDITVEAARPFIITVKTDNTGGTSDVQFKIDVNTLGYSFNYKVDCDNDGIYESTNITGNHICTYGVAGTYTIHVLGDLPNVHSAAFNSDKEKWISIDQWGTNLWRTFDSAFSGCINMTIPAVDNPNLREVHDMSYTFQNADSLNDDISNWDMSSVTTMLGMFNAANIFNQDISSWDVSAVVNMQGMFQGAGAFNQSLNGWDVSSVTDMNKMFQDSIFNSAISDWNVSHVRDMNAMFFNAPFNQNISAWDVSTVKNMSSMFSDTPFNQNIGAWNTSAVEQMKFMFSNTPFNQDIGTWDVSSVQDMSSMFADTPFNQDISGWTVDNVKDMSYMFSNTSNFNQPIGIWNTVSVMNMSNMFRAATVFNQDISLWSMGNVEDTSSMFSNAFAFNQDIGDWDVATVGTMFRMFLNASSFNQDIGDWDIGSVENMSAMFVGTSMTVSNYNLLLIGWSSLVPSVQPNVPLDMDSKYGASATTSRDALISRGWMINDGGLE